jgi:hypothetical protein
MFFKNKLKKSSFFLPYKNKVQFVYFNFKKLNFIIKGKGNVRNVS